MQKSKIKRIAAVLLGTGLCLLMPVRPQTADAAADQKITLTCRQDETILQGVQWTLYEIGERNGNEIRFNDALASYSLDLGDLSADAVDTAAKTLECYVIAAGLQPIAQGKTDANGELVFDGLDNGLYLAVGKTLQVEEICYFPSTLLLEVNDSDTGLSYDAFPKFYAENRSSLDKNYIVKKVWVDDEAGNIARPVNVTVDLYEDGALRDTVTLSDENKWQYRWESLDATSNWTVVEREIPVNYEVMIDYNSQQYLIRNSYKPTTEVTTTATTVSTQTTTTSAPPTTTITTATKERLVQTGQLWWPVLPLSVGGVLLIGTGITVKDGKKKDEE